MKLSGWGRHPVVDCAVQRPRRWDALAELVRRSDRVIPRGNGRAYGDAALNADLTLSMLGMDRMADFDPATGLLTCESGVLLRTILDSFVPRGWMPVVVPGTAWVTVGGMVAADVHGKNHHVDGSFGRHVEALSLVTAGGETLRCSPDENADLFHATIGGMGLTGVIRSATFRLRRIATDHVGVETLAAPDLERAMALLAGSRDWPYSVAWIDCLARGAALGRSLVTRASVLERGALPHRRRFARQTTSPGLAVPCDAPGALLNRWSVSAFNTLYYRLGRLRASVRRPVPIDAYFFPLDRVSGWNRLYGRAGFTQYQCVLPESQGPRGVRALLECLSASGSGSFLGVLKLLGAPIAGLMSFPMQGYTLAVDLPLRPDAPRLLEALDEITCAHGGRVYLAKDAFCTAERVRLGYPHVESFRSVRDATGAAGKFASALSARLDL